MAFPTTSRVPTAAIAQFARRWYRRLTVDHPRWACIAPVAALAGAGVLVTFLLGIVNGANAARAGEALAPLLADTQAVEAAVWQEMGDVPAVTRVLYGPLHLVTALAVGAAMAGAWIGHTAPVVAHAVMALDPLVTVAIPVVLALQLLRMIEVLVGRGRRGPADA